MSIDAFDFFDKDGPAPRMKIRCCNYDMKQQSGTRITAKVDLYIPLPKFLVLTHDIEAGVFAKKKQVRERKASSPGEGTLEYFCHFGGEFQSEPQRATGGVRECTSRRLTLVDGLGDASFAFLAMEQPGEVDPKTGLIIPKKGCKATASIFINMPDEKLKEFAMIGPIYSEQFIGLLL